MERSFRIVTALEGYNLWAPTYDETLNPVVFMDARHSVRVLSPAAGELILDAGCGTGRNLGPIKDPGARPIGVDFSPAMLEVAHRLHPDVDLAVADLQRTLPFGDARFEATICTLVGEHLAELPSVLAELRRVLKPGGRLVFSVYHPDMAAAGIEANFNLGGVEYRLGPLKYTVQDYLDYVAGADFDEIAFASFRGDQGLADQVPGAAKYVGLQVLLVIGATVRSS
jgi:SAM-dependent methyltransferase